MIENTGEALSKILSTTFGDQEQSNRELIEQKYGLEVIFSKLEERDVVKNMNPIILVVGPPKFHENRSNSKRVSFTRNLKYSSSHRTTL